MAIIRPLSAIARDVRQHWPNVHYSARPYLDAMATLETMADHYGWDSATEIVLRFLGNAQTWRGADARRIKAELRAMLRHFGP